MRKYAVVIEKVPNSNFGAYVPDLPGCVSAGDTLEEVKRNIQEAIEFHLEGMREDGDAIPKPPTFSTLRLRDETLERFDRSFDHS